MLDRRHNLTAVWVDAADVRGRWSGAAAAPSSAWASAPVAGGERRRALCVRTIASGRILGLASPGMPTIGKWRIVQISALPCGVAGILTSVRVGVSDDRE
jgi:hypothetical protein